MPLAIIARRALVHSTVETAAQFGTGALNLGQCKVGSGLVVTTSGKGFASEGFQGGRNDNGGEVRVGRWAANAILKHTSDCAPSSPKVVSANGHFPPRRPKGGSIGPSGHLGQEGLVEAHLRQEVVSGWICSCRCPASRIDLRLTTTGVVCIPIGEKSDVSRFFIQTV